MKQHNFSSSLLGNMAVIVYKNVNSPTVESMNRAGGPLEKIKLQQSKLSIELNLINDCRGGPPYSQFNSNLRM